MINFLFPKVGLCKNNQDIINKKKAEKLGTGTANAINKAEKPDTGISRVDAKKADKPDTSICRTNIKKRTKQV